MNLCFITDPLVVTVGSVKPAILLAKGARELGYKVKLVSPCISKEVKELIEKYGIEPKDLGMKPSLLPSLPTFEAWARSLFKRKSFLSFSGDHVLINTSSCLKIKADIYYAQGPMMKALDDIFPEMPKHYRYAYYSFSFLLKLLERKSIKEFRHLSKVFISNSNFCALMYEDYGVKVDGVIYPPLDFGFFKPATSKPSADYVLTYIGPYSKETRFSVLRMVADAGVRIRAFGSKAHYMPNYVCRHPNIKFLGRVSDYELVNLYSNALYTLFTFNHEPFGYVPVESMACGTPVLTYSRQGPKESVIQDETGWLVNNDDEIVQLAIKIWKEGYSSEKRRKCFERASFFDFKKTVKQWIKLISVK